MDTQTLFTIAFPLAAPFWLLMIVAPGWSVTRRIISSPLVAVPPLLVYVALLLPQFGAFAGAVASGSHPAVLAVFATPAGASVIWAHLIGFDLFIGRWMYLDARTRGIHPLVMAPVLLVTILLSPIGLLTYLLLRALLPNRALKPTRSASGTPAPPAAATP